MLPRLTKEPAVATSAATVRGWQPRYCSSTVTAAGGSAAANSEQVPFQFKYDVIPNYSHSRGWAKDLFKIANWDASGQVPAGATKRNGKILPCINHSATFQGRKNL